jgi:imidazolonepropionase-like amidohydrolase
MKTFLLGAAFLLALPAPARAATPKDAPIAIVGATVLVSPTQPPIPGGVVVLQGGKVLAVGTAQEVSIPKNATRVEGKGLTLSAGFWNCHVHLNGPSYANAGTAAPEALSAALEKMLNRYGFTTVVDAGSMLSNTVALRARVEKGEVAGPRILTAGAPLFPKDGIPIYLTTTLSPEVLAQLYQPTTAEEAKADVAKNLAGGADATKLFAGSWLGGTKTAEMPLAILRAAAEATHQAKKQVLAHPQTLGGVRNAQAGGVDVLMHTTPNSGPWPKELVSALVASHTALVPTLSLWTEVARGASMTPERTEAYVQGGVSQLRDYFKAGGEVLFGTDVGFTNATDTAEELIRMAQAGLGWRDTLASLTTSPARRFGGGGTGVVAKGEPADVVLFQGEPVKNPRAFSQVVLSYRGGKLLYQAPK